jgi:hypothetical protein
MGHVRSEPMMPMTRNQIQSDLSFCTERCFTAHTTKKRTPSAAIMENDAWSIQTMATHGAGEEAYIIEKGGKARRVYAL